MSASLAAQATAALAASDADAWLVHSFRGSNPVFGRLVADDLFLTRRAFLLLRPGRRAKLLVSRVDATDAVTSLPDFDVELYLSHRELRDRLAGELDGARRVAMEYSPLGALPALSWVDGGTLELVRDLGVEVVSSAELLQRSAAVWSDASRAAHERAMEHVAAVKDGAFAEIGRRLAAGAACDEHGIQRWILEQFAERGLTTQDPPVVAANAHSGDPHYVPSANSSAPIGPGDWVLIDLWAREPAHDAVYADITWVGYVGEPAPSRHQEVFDVVAAARDAVVDRLRAGDRPEGCELDRVARAVIEDAGLGPHFVHRTGHSLSPGDPVHGLGANLDDLETHDTRRLEPGLGATVEPGVYLPEFGVRLEINLFVAENGPVVTSPVQTAPVRIG